LTDGKKKCQGFRKSIFAFILFKISMIRKDLITQKSKIENELCIGGSGAMWNMGQNETSFYFALCST
jgi:hypothetical protein